MGRHFAKKCAWYANFSKDVMQAAEQIPQDEITFLPIDQSLIDGVWPQCVPLIEQSFSRNAPSYAIDDVYGSLMHGESQLWIALGMGKIMGAAVTMVTQEPKAKTCSILHVAGSDVKLWIHQLEIAINKFAASHGCDYLEAVTRKGFHRYLKDWQEDGIVYVKKVSHG